MRRCFVTAVYLFFLVTTLDAQSPQPDLTVDMIMRDPSWMGTSPTSVRWSENGEWVYFNWRTTGDEGDSLYKVRSNGGIPVRVSVEERRELPPVFGGSYDHGRTRKVFARDGDIFVYDIRKSLPSQLTRTVEREVNPAFTHDGTGIVFVREQNLFRRDLRSGLEIQMTNLASGSPQRESTPTELQRHLIDQQTELFQVLRDRKQKREATEALQRLLAVRHPRPYHVGQRTVSALTLSPDERFVSFVLTQRSSGEKRTIVPRYVSESGFTEDIPARSKVGEPQSTQEFCLYDVVRDTVIILNPDTIDGIVPAAIGEKKKPKPREVLYYGPYWSEDGRRAFVQVYSRDNKDRWIVLLDVESASFGSVVEHQRDTAWIGGPGISGFSNAVGWMPDSERLWFQSEADGWSHLYVVNEDGTGKKQLTIGAFEVYNPSLSLDKKRWYFSSNEVHFGERHFYTMALEGGTRTRVTTMEGRNDVDLSPDGKRIAVVHSTSNTMPELYLMENRPGTRATKVTSSMSDEFRSYSWRAPEVLTITARDGANIPARLYKPANPNGAAVIFVHGAGYLQNAHKWWSTYFREYMFHNLLVDKGYTVLDMDYRASAGLGRDWRTSIYRFMGGKDLEDNVDGARWLVANNGIDPSRIGIYGGSYGGFITFMAMFTTPGVFAAGAALRPVSDWAHYNHGYTSNILNIPQEDTVAFRRSSPIYHAEGLQGALLICHGMVDVNVHFQDAVRVVQRLIELKKENWELAVYPVEDHGFVEPTSWMDEYKRVLKLFETNLGRGR